MGYFVVGTLTDSNHCDKIATSFFATVLFRRFLSCICLLLLASGCASYGVIENTVVTSQSPAKKYSIKEFAASDDNSEILLILSFSGGGTRAAAMAYGVMQELRDTNVMLMNKSTRLLDEVDTISSVSGGSFTAAYYGLHGDGMFDTFEDVFLRKNVEKKLILPLFNPFRWFSSKGRTEWAVNYYQNHIFHGATYADMMQPGRPLIIINASDMAYGVRFSFIQEYFDLLCSDLLSFPVARAVTASSAVPVAFNPIVIENFAECGTKSPEWLKKVGTYADAKEIQELGELAAGLESYSDKEQRKYIHFVDGGITDNVGLRAVYDIVKLFGGITTYMERSHRRPPSKIVLITVDASTSPVFEMDKTNKQPSMKQTISATTGIQLHRYNSATIDLVQTSLNSWAETMSKPEKPVSPYFIEISFEDLTDSPVREFFNTIPTSFFLEDEQIDKLIEAGRQLLRKHPDFQQLLADIKNS